MLTTAKVFTTGNSQAIRLPKAFRVDVSEMWISKNEVSGEITLKPKDDDRRQRNVAELFRMIRMEPFSEDFIPPRSDEVRPNPFDEWAEPVQPKRTKSAARTKK
jgi:antitoxin VapB